MEEIPHKPPVSALTLGTVQLGLDYGIANPSGKPNMVQAHRILQCALDNHITTIDTSRHYGNSEEVIGSFLKSYVGAVKPFIVTKFRWENLTSLTEKAALIAAKEQVKQSCDQLGIPRLPLVLYHKGKDESISQVMRLLPDILQELKQEGMIDDGGLSLYYPDEATLVVDEPAIRAVQVPINVLDQRLISNGAMRHFFDAGKTVFARSVFLQGLFFMGEDQIPRKLGPIVPYLRNLRELAASVEMGPAQFAFAYVRDTIGVDSVIFGADHEGHVTDSISFQQSKALSDAMRERIRHAFSNIPAWMLTPGYW